MMFKNLSILKHKKKHKIIVGDMVLIKSGADKGKIAKVLRISKTPLTIKVLVEGCAMRNNYTKKTTNSPGRMEKKESYIDISNVAFYDTKSSKHTKIGYKLSEDGRKKRFAKISGEFISQ